MAIFGIDTSGFTGLLFKLLTSLFFWFGAIIIFVVIVFGGLIIRKKRKLKYPLIELVPLGKGKMGVETGQKCGWFKHHTTLFGLYDYGGEDVMKAKDGRQVQDISTEDFHEINGKRGIVAMRSPEDPRILVPLSKMKIDNDYLLSEIAPAGFRSTAVDIIRDADKETSERWEKIVMWVALGGVIIFALISIILITQMVKNGQAEAKDLILQAGDTCLKSATEICGQIASTAPSSAP